MNAKGKENVVEVKVDGDTKQIARGIYSLSELKVALGVDESRELLEIKGKEPKPINENAKIHIEGKEVFVTHARTGGSA